MRKPENFRPLYAFNYDVSVSDVHKGHCVISVLVSRQAKNVDQNNFFCL